MPQIDEPIRGDTLELAELDQVMPGIDRNGAPRHIFEVPILGLSCQHAWVMNRRGLAISVEPGECASVASSDDITSLETYRDVGALVQDLRALYYVTGIELMLRIGQLILERLYDGDVTRWKSRARKDFSFRKLEQHPDLPFKAAMLSRAVSIYVLSRRRPDLPKLENVSQTHLQEILSLQPDVQDQLLTRVQEEKWTVQRLRAEARTFAGQSSHVGRPRTPVFVKQLRNLRSIVDNRLLVMDSENVAVLQFREAQELLDAARRLCQQAEQVTRMLAAHVAVLQREGAPEPPLKQQRHASDVVPRDVSSTKHSRSRRGLLAGS